MVNEANLREIKRMMANLTEEEQEAVAMDLSSSVLIKELGQRLIFSEAKNNEIYEIAKKARIYGKAVEKANPSGASAVNFLSSKLDGMGKG